MSSDFIDSFPSLQLVIATVLAIFKESSINDVRKNAKFSPTNTPQVNNRLRDVNLSPEWIVDTWISI